MTHASAPTSTTTVYVRDLNDHIIAELNALGQTQREYIWLDDMPVAVVDNVASGNPVIYYVHVDHLMRPARMTAQDTSWVWDVIYAPFGGVSYIWSNPANIDLRFSGQWFQLESGLAYNWHRHYDATLGRYVQPDPIGLVGGRNIFGYANQSPGAYTDFEGLTSAGAILGGQIGSWIGGIIGSEVAGPLGIGSGRWIGAVVGKSIGDWVTGPEIVLGEPEISCMAQNNKQTRKRIQSLRENIDEHQQKIEKDPDSRDANHWRSEIKAWQSTIDNLNRRLRK